MESKISDHDAMEDLLKAVKGGDWRPTTLLKTLIVKELYDTVVKLKNRLNDLDIPQIKRDIARLNYNVAKAHKTRFKDQELFVAYIATALGIVDDIVVWYWRNKKLLRGGVKNGNS